MYASGGIMIQGNTFFQQATVTGAENGTSLNNGKVVLGNDFGDPAEPALLSGDREIPFDLGGAALIFSFPSTGDRIQITPTTIEGQNLGQIKQFQLDPGIITVQDSSGVTSPQLRMFAPTNEVVLRNDDGVAVMRGAPTNKQLTIDLVNLKMILGPTGGPDTGASLQIPVDITTGDPGSGQGAWQLGQVQAAAVAFDPTQYVETTINGVTVKLAIVN